MKCCDASTRSTATPISSLMLAYWRFRSSIGTASCLATEDVAADGCMGFIAMDRFDFTRPKEVASGRRYSSRRKDRIVARRTHEEEHWERQPEAHRRGQEAEARHPGHLRRHGRPFGRALLRPAKDALLHAP